MTQASEIKLLWIFSSFADGPAARRFAVLAEQLGPKYEHAIAAVDDDYSATALIPRGARWRKIAAPKRKRGLISIGGMWNARKLLLAERPHLLLTSNFAALDWLVVNRGPGACPHVHFEDAAGEDGASEAEINTRAWARRRAFPGRDRVFVAADRCIERRLAELWGAPEAQIRLIRDGVDLDGAARQATPGQGESLTIAATGPFVAERRLDRVVRIVASLRERGRPVALRLIGDGPERGALASEIETHGLSDASTFAAASGDAIVDLAGADLFVALPDAPLCASDLSAAMALRIPVLATDQGEAGAALAGESRLFVRSGSDESALAAAAELLCADAPLRREIGDANRARAEAEFGREAMVETYDALFKSLTADRRRLALPAPQPAKRVEPVAPEVKTPVETSLKGAEAAAKSAPKKPARRRAKLPVVSVKPLADGVIETLAKRAKSAAKKASVKTEGAPADR